jgi:hypothetical protein
MLASLVAQGASKLVCPEGVYHALSENFMPKGHGAAAADAPGEADAV